ncbi:MAG TPA: Rossmann-like and DUF2520 domain-containing protein [Baekduia sp.]|uniref:Rossmann-like and DUF2520 domain-containing protein n=1 Tax=Baekduia sp. TaxID=2600305 RepID=UPI002D784CC4|nr:Rossmann-like and DUF2520 domain-containing protein [Baekduia sp.]HET6506152.1 Rossmann-like and DUF2520 domain-containing protein [Baekduia sp.]
MNSELPACAVVGHGRLGTALAEALRAAGVRVDGPLGRGATASDAPVVLLAVPDGEIANAAAAVSPGRLVGHCSGATTLQPLSDHHARAFSLHPLMTITTRGATFTGAHAAVAGSDENALRTAEDLARALGMIPFTVPDADRAAYHAAASIASNFLITLQWAAERVGGVDRHALAPLVRATVENWVAEGPRSALTGPIARGDEATVARQRAAVADRAPDLAPLFDALAAATRDLAAGAPA